MILADKIIDLRKKNGWSQEELAEKLGVSRQAVSKWESAQAIPDLGRVLAMADLFSVTTDYLLRDENEAPTPAAVEDGASESSVRRVSMEEASAFLALCRKQAPTRALAVSLCVLSPIPLLMILSRTGEGPAAGVGSIIGVVILLLLEARADVPVCGARHERHSVHFRPRGRDVSGSLGGRRRHGRGVRPSAAPVYADADVCCAVD